MKPPLAHNQPSTLRIEIGPILEQPLDDLDVILI